MIADKLVILSLLCIGVWSLPYTKNDGVISLTKSNFAETVFGSEYVWLVEFYAPWCGHCKNLAPEWIKLAKTYQGIIKVAAVNGDEEKELAGAFKVQGFPTIKLFPSKAVQKGEGFIKEPVDYNGARTAAAMAQFALSYLPNFVTTVTDKNVDEFLSSSPELPKALLFTNKKETTPLYKGLAIDYHYTLNLGQVKDTDKAVVEKYKVDKYPTLLVVKEGEEPVKYTGELKHEALFNFLKKYAPTKPQQPPKSSSSTKKTEAPKEPEELPRDVTVEITDQATWETICFNKAKSCIIAFLDPINAAPEEHQRYLELLKNLGEKNKNRYSFIWMDALKQTHLVDHFRLANVFPNLMLFHHKKGAYVPYVGGFDESSITEFLDRALSGGVRPAPIKDLPSMASSKKDEL